MRRKITDLKVFFHLENRPLNAGKLALRNGEIYFEYDPVFITTGLEISPFNLPLGTGVFKGNNNIFEGLFGVFNDSLPDGWGRLLLDRRLRKNGIEPGDTGPLDRIACTGFNGMGALSYEPDMSGGERDETINLDVIMSEIEEVQRGESGEIIEHLSLLNGSSAGARPKVMAGVSQDKKSIIHGIQKLPPGYDHWIIKFPFSGDMDYCAQVEYAYSLMARDCGITMTETFLFQSAINSFFGINRFDREGEKRIHMHTVSGLLNADHRIPALDYLDLLKTARLLTKDIREVEKLFRVAVFNVIFHNRDDHSKNFSFIMDKKGTWSLSPSYDLTFSSGPGGEHSTMITGEGKNPAFSDLKKLGKTAGLKEGQIMEILERVRHTASQWKAYCEQAGIPSRKMKEIQERFVVR